MSLIVPDQAHALPIEMSRVIWIRNHESGVEFVELPLHTRLHLNRILRAVLIQFLNARKDREWQNPAVKNPSLPVIQH